MIHESFDPASLGDVGHIGHLIVHGSPVLCVQLGVLEVIDGPVLDEAGDDILRSLMQADLLRDGLTDKPRPIAMKVNSTLVGLDCLGDLVKLTATFNISAGLQRLELLLACLNAIFKLLDLDVTIVTIKPLE